MTVLLVFLGGAVGAPTRYLVDRWIQSRHRIRFPFGTLAVNLTGCLILGLVAGGVARHSWSANVQAGIGTGFCGGLTTFSTFSVETVELLAGRAGLSGRAGRAGFRALAYLLFSCGAGIGLAALGYQVA